MRLRGHLHPNQGGPGVLYPSPKGADGGCTLPRQHHLVNRRGCVQAACRPACNSARPREERMGLEEMVRPCVRPFGGTWR
eukprot:5392500-Alexandrium_andersonii.AAC.1